MKPFVFQAQAFQNKPGLIRARVKDWDGDDLTRDVFASGTYTLIDTSTGEAIEGHEGISIVEADSIFDTLQTPSSGRPYNFLLYLDNTDDECFPTGGVVVRCEIELVDTLGREIPLWGNINVLNSEIPAG